MILVSCSAALGEDGPHAGVSDVHLHHELMSRVRMKKDGSLNEQSLQLLEGSISSGRAGER